MPDPINKRDLLKQRFNPNSVPTAQDFHDLIDAAMIQEDDGVARIVPDPLDIEARDPRLEAIRFYKNIENDPGPTWLLEMKPRAVDNVPSTSADGLNISNAAKESLLFMQEAPTNRIGIGTLDPQAKLHIANDSPNAVWRYDDIKDHISLELGKNGTGKLGSIKLNSYDNNQFCLIRPSNGNYHVDSTRGAYFFNWDNPDIAGKLYIGGANSADAVKFDAAGHSYLNGGHVGIGTASPAAKLQVVNGAIMPAPGNSEQAGIMFPRDAFGGGGDAAWVRYYARQGEATTFEIGTANDGDDNIALISPGGVGINTNTPEASLDIHTPYNDAISIHRTSWAADEKWKISTEGASNDTSLTFSWKTRTDRRFVLHSNGNAGFGPNRPSARLEVHGIQLNGTHGRNYFKDEERSDGLGLRVGTAWGKYGIYAQNGPAVVGGELGVHFQDDAIAITPDGRMAIGAGEASPPGKFMSAGRMDLRRPGVNYFPGLYPETTDNRAQLVLQSAYSDMVIASSHNNDNHGSTLSFVAYNPSNAADYRKFVMGQGNWGARKHFLDFGYKDDASTANPHVCLNATDTVATMDGLNNRLGVGTMNPEHTLDVKGEIKTDKPYYLKGMESFKVDGDANKYYPVIIHDENWEGGILEMELMRADVHTDSAWRGSLMAKLSFHSTHWGHGSNYWSIWVRQNNPAPELKPFINGVENSFHRPYAAIWLKGGGTTYFWKSNHKMVVFDARAVDTKNLFDENGTTTTVSSKTAIEPAFDSQSYQVDSHGLMGGASFPQGMITMYSGATTPVGWALCDGGNGTPDLRGRFVLGAGQGPGLSNRTVGQTGGLQSVTLSLAQLPAHKHVLNDPGHYHTWTASRQNAGVDDHNNGSEFSRGDNSASSPIVKDTNSKTTGITMNNAGSNAAHENMPPFYVLAYIMKL